MRFSKMFPMVVLILLLFVSVDQLLSQIMPGSLSFPFNSVSGEWKVTSGGGYNNGAYHGTFTPYAQYALDLERKDGSTEGQFIHAPTNVFYVRQQGTPDCVDFAIAEYSSTHWLWLEMCHIDLESYIPQRVYQPNIVVKGQVVGRISSSICGPAGRCPIPHIHMAAHISPKFVPFGGGGRLPLPFSITTWDLRLDGRDFSTSSNHNGETGLFSSLPAQCVAPPTVNFSPLVFVQSLAHYPNVCGYTEQYVGGADATPAPIVPTGPNWLLEFSKADRMFYVDIHTRVDAVPGVYSAHRVLVDGVNIGETSSAEQFITWGTYGWADGYHTMRVEYRRVSDNGNWATALAHEEQFYLSPNRNGTAPCDGRDGIQMSSGSDCIILTQTFPALDVIGWKERQPLTVTVRGNFEAWFEYTHQPQVVYSGETRSMGLVTQVELRTPAPPPPPPPSSAFTVDANTVYLFPLNEGSGTQTVDIASGLVGTLGSGVGWVPSQFGSALVFPDAASYGVSTAAFDVCPMTVELWVRKNDTWGNIAGQLGGLNKWSLTFDNLRPRIEIWSAGGSQWVTSFQTIQLGTWHYIMFTYDCGTRQAKLYLDNVLVGELTTPAVWNSGAYPFYIGSSNNGNRCRCEIDELRISNVVRVPSTEPTATPTIMPSVTASPTPTPTATATETGAVVDSTGTGLLGEYFNGVTLSGPSETRLDPTVNLNTHDSPHPFVGADNFSIRWTGFVEPLYSEPYQICTWSDDGIRVSFNGQLVIDNWTNHGAALDCGSVGNLTAGIEYPITVEYYEIGGGAVAQLGWSSPSQQEDLVPQSQLYPAPAVTNTPVPSDTPVPTATETPQFTETPTETPTETATSTPTATATDTPVPTNTSVPQTDVLLSQGKSTSANNQKAGFEAQKANDGSMETYWEGEDYTNAELTTDLGAVYTVNSVVLKLGWEGRYEEVAIWISTDGVNFTPVAPAAYYFLGTVQIPIPSVQARYVGIEITDNSVVPAAQLAELEVWGH